MNPAPAENESRMRESLNGSQVDEPLISAIASTVVRTPPKQYSQFFSGGFLDAQSCLAAERTGELDPDLVDHKDFWRWHRYQ
jgi:hypothetical protein